MGIQVEEKDSTWVPQPPKVTKKFENVYKRSGKKKAHNSGSNVPTWSPETPKVTENKNDFPDDLKVGKSDDEEMSSKRPQKKMKRKIRRPKVFDSRPVKIATPKPRTPPNTESKSRKGKTPKTKTPRTPKIPKSGKEKTPKTGKERKVPNSAKSRTPKADGRCADESNIVTRRSCKRSADESNIVTRRSCRRKLDFCDDTNDENSDQKRLCLPWKNDESDRIGLSTSVKFKKRRKVPNRMSLVKLTRLVEMIRDKCLRQCEFPLNLSWMRQKRKRSNRRRRVYEFIAANNKSELPKNDAHEHIRDDVNMVGLDIEDDRIGNVKLDDLELFEIKVTSDSSNGTEKVETKLPIDLSFQPPKSMSVFSIRDVHDGKIYADFLSQRIVTLHISDKADSKQLVLFRPEKKNGKRKLKETEVDESKQLILLQKKKNAKAYRIDLDDMTLKIWDIGVQNNEGEASKEEEEQDEREYWEKERDECVRKLNSVMDRILPYLGHRPYSRWKGSVVDSIVGVFLTQNVSDSLSSSAFMDLTARYPPPGKINNSGRSHQSQPNELSQIDLNIDLNESNSQVESSQVDDPQQDESNSHVELDQIDQNIDLDIGDKTSIELSQDSCISELSNCTPTEDIDVGDKISMDLSQVCSTSEYRICIPSEGTRWAKKPGKGKGKYDSEEINWDELRKKYGKSENRPDDCMDSVDWEAVRQASAREFATVIEQRGMSNQLAGKIKAFLDRVVKDHGSIDLEWLRHVPANDAKDYLLSIYGLGLKSADCVMLLSLHQQAFPVDVNISRVLVRLGIVPLKPLPENVLFHNLDDYPLLDDVEKYLWPRICNLDVKTLYALHCYLNAFSKAFCTKVKPNCKACPLVGDCKHYASLTRSRMRIEYCPSQEKEVDPKSSKNLVGDVCEGHQSTQNFEPIIEFPPSPEHALPEQLELDIEDIGSDNIPLDNKVISTIVKNSRSILGDFDDNISKALVALKPRIAPPPTPKLKHEERLRTVHLVFEVPDSHPLLKGFDNRESEDPNPYLIAIWLDEQNEDTFEDSKIPEQSTSCGVGSSCGVVYKRPCSCPQSSSCRIDSCCSRGIVQYRHVETVKGTILVMIITLFLL